MQVIPLAAHAVRQSAVILPFPTRQGPGVASNERVAALMVAMEARPLSAPVIRVCRGIDRVSRVHVGAGGQAAILNPHEARLCADAIFAENALPGCGLVAARLRAAADACDRDAAFHPTQARTHVTGPHVTGLGTLIGLAGMGLFVFGLLLAGARF